MNFPRDAGLRKYQFSWFNSSNIEIRDLTKAWIAISLAFAILLNHGLNLSARFGMIFIISAFTVGVGFLLHEMGHKIVAQKFGCFAEFRSFDQMLLLAIFFSFFGFILAAPGAVMIGGRHVSISKNGKISVAGPLINVILALFFLLALQVQNIYALRVGLAINALLALFNMIPIGNFDGRKILAWNRYIWGSVSLMGAGLMYASMQYGWL
jgi:Zn-dependent protease